jgi:hypothetical protein
MRALSRGGILVAAVTAVLAIMTSVPAWAASTVSSTPATWTPQMVGPKGTSSYGYLRQLIACGSTMYAVGTFTQIKSPADGNKLYTRDNGFAFNGTTGKMTAFDPETNGVINSITLSPDCGTAYLAGRFSTVGGVAAKNIAAVNATTGALITTFAHTASAEVETVLYTHGEVLAGGYFATIGGATRARLASLNPTTGKADSYLTLGLTGSYPGVSNATRGYAFQLSHSGRQLLLTGDFTAVGGVARQQIVELDLGAPTVTVDGWTSPVFSTTCNADEPFWLQSAAYSPDDATIYTAATGRRSSTPGVTGICDAAAAFPNPASSVSSRWVNYTGCDSLFAVTADANTVYIAGHERWINNPDGCDQAGAGAIARPGVGAIDATTGLATTWNPTRSRGLGADDALIAFNGLWIASDNWDNSVKCGNVAHAGICFFPY